MFNSYRTISELLVEYNEHWSVENSLTNASVYWAHTPNKVDREPETLGEHLHLAQSYFENLVKVHDLDFVINRLIIEYLNEIEVTASTDLVNWIKRLFVHTICYHDHGKVNENFQASSQKMNNPEFKGKENIENGIDTQHSTLSSFIYLNQKFIQIAKDLKTESECYCAFTMAILFSYNIYRHHSYHLRDDFWRKIIVESKRTDKLKSYLNLFQNIPPNEKALQFISELENLKSKRLIFDKYDHSFALYQLLRLNFSLLTAADYMATNEYMNDISVQDFGVLDQTAKDALIYRVQKDQWIDKTSEKINYNKKIYDELQSVDLEVKPKEKSNKNLNHLRQQMATESIRNIQKNLDKNIFYLEAPTGGGKTNISMLLTLELLKSNSELNKVYYVFPFTTLIDQTFKSLKEILGLSNKEIIALHSRASYHSTLETDEIDANYGKEKENYIDRLFVNFPFTLLSHVRFFDVLKTNVKEVNYMLHRLANSVVVIDELQSYNPNQWDKMIYFIQKYADLYNIRFIIMSATLPKISRLQIKGLNTDNVVYLLPNSRKDYFNNPNFSDRVTFDFSLSEERISLENLAEKVLNESKLYSKLDQGIAKPRDSVYTVVEFIFKNAATLFEKEIQRINNNFFDEIFVLSGTILSHRRKFIINYLKNIRNRSKKILLITTQVVEAGVDIDMDLGFKDSSLIDSDEQLAGRINRNVNKQNCKLFLFNCSREAVIYGKDLRYELTKKLSNETKASILQTKNFDLLYEKVIEFKNTQNKDQNIVGIEDYVQKVDSLQFETIANDFKLIDQENFSCFIPLAVPISISSILEDEREEIFTSLDLSFLAENNIFPDQDERVSGVEIFDLYMDLIHSSKPFMTKNIEIKQVQSILSNYVFSLFSSDKNKSKLIEFSDLEKNDFGYFYVSRWQDIYSEDTGIDESAFENIENQFI